jgi:hypothetical protein
MDGIFEKKFCRERGQGGSLNAPKWNSQINSWAGMIKNDELGFYRFTEYVRIPCQNNDCHIRRIPPIWEILPQVVKLTIENSERYRVHSRFL